ncbi:MAG TPA: aromatic ring-hydroxylating dioxygenase subunit alpha [Sphingomonas sp.]|nr:aromatic ring-hydroxylating dioxygenase subunit alpha [Sphingomonas sp.]
MPFLRNAWYVAGWESGLESGPIARTILDEPILIVRNGDQLSAFSDMCPHRFAPLSRGKIGDGYIRCPYHGLQFDMSGRCVANPHGNGARPSSLSLRSFPVRVKQGLIWIWMGSAERADGCDLPDYPFLVDPALATLRGYLHVQADYLLVVDNLLDLSHVEFLHPFLAEPGSARRIQLKAVQQGQKVTAYHHMPDQPNSPLFKALLGPDVERIDARAHMHWQAPANLMLDVGATLPGQPEGRQANMLQAHLLTPETATTCHYFWGVSRDTATDDSGLSEMLHIGIANAFENEDEPMVRAVQQRMRGRDLLEMSPALLSIDEASVRARRILRDLVAEEQASDSRARDERPLESCT